MLWDTITYERNEKGFSLAQQWKPHGVIGIIGRPDLMKLAKELQVPMVNIHGGQRIEGAAQIGCDHRAIGHLAAEHLSSLGFSYFACAGFPMEDPNLDRRLGGFIETLGGRNVEFYDYRGDYAVCPQIRGSFIQADDEHLHRWVWSLRKPCAVFASGDMVAARILRACLHLGVQVPEELAIVGVGDIPEFCLDLPIALSSVSVPWEKLGFEAAAMLSKMMAGGRMQKEVVLLPPQGITHRRSSDIYAVGDRQVADALRFIRLHACERINVSDILKKVPMGRRVLERKFREVLNRSPHEEILRIRLDKAAQLLIHTNATLESIAGDAGFSTVTRLSVEFKKRFDIPPGAYRKHFQK